VTKPINILEVSASGRRSDSVSRQLTADVVNALEDRYGSATIVRRDLNDGVGFVDESWIAANFTAAEERTTTQRERLAESDELVAELEAADVIVIGAPIYNFGVPATLKAWVDQVARARVTFRYTDSGPEGLLKGKKAYILIASGGVPVDAAVDFATPYLRHALGFLGIDDVEVIAADRLNVRGAEAVDEARRDIAERIHTSPRPNSAAA
jgi:FMN-dependent NADH-azoreductase